MRKSRIRIGVDLLLLSQFSDTGMVSYATEILPRLFREMQDCDWVLFCKAESPFPYQIGDLRHVKVVHSFWMRSPWLWKLLGASIASLVYRLNLFFIPVARVPLIPICKTVAFIHDVGYLTMPEYLDAGTLMPTRVSIRHAAIFADAILTNSEFTRRAFCEQYNVPKSRVHVTYLGYDGHLFNEAAIPPERSQAVLDRYGIRKPYVLYLGVIQGRKNLKALIQAAESWSARRPDLQLVLAGKRGWNCEDIYSEAEKLPSLVRLIGRVDGEERPILYSNAECFVLPSLYEGFGMPVIESMACGTANVLSKKGALPEVAGQAAVYFDPYDTGQIEDAILKVVEDHHLRLRLQRMGVARCRTFTWDAVSSATVAVLRALVRSDH
jgi:glycosyltransferase involved in cell wall biosynthesis